MGPRAELEKLLAMLNEIASEFVEEQAQVENEEMEDEGVEVETDASINLGLVGDVKEDLAELFEDFITLYNNGIVRDDDLVWVITSDLIQIGIIPSEVGKVNYLINLNGEVIGSCKKVKEMVKTFGRNVTELIRTAEDVEELTDAIRDEFKELYNAIEFMARVIIPIKRAERAEKEDRLAMANAKLKRVQAHLDELEKEENDNQEN